ncbi:MULTISPECIES: NUDIX hydrolase [Pseudomonas syringae group]|uniref:NUDIX hydrolase n=1 Tax=Pseudomonas syringae group TaxID=136849 RepID=UPI001C315EDF|nr:NUDIX domain-containing protein [Pseudomonas viridiflava]QXG50109.1 NUDIX domain-containing protein [Pseudomonas viridiflava]
MTTIGVFANIVNEDGQVLCVQRNYAPFGWTVPGGRLEHGESPEQGVIREVFEETGCRVIVERLVGIYSAPFRSDLVIYFQCKILTRQAWQPDSEIAAADFFPVQNLPYPMKNNTRIRIQDACTGKIGVWRTFSKEEHS